MLLGTSKQDITPSEPIELAGFAHREGKTSEVEDSLFLKTFAFQSDDKTFLFLVADLIWWDNTQVEGLKRELESRFNVPGEQICFHATHNHSGPQTSYRFSKELGEPSPKYLEFLKRQVNRSVDESFSNMEKVKMELQRGIGKIGISRRKKENGNIQMAPNLKESVDNELITISFVTEKDERKVIWVHYACHPTTTDANILSTEFVGRCCKEVEKVYPRSIVAFLQGFCGDIRPALLKENSFYRGTIEDMVKTGKEFSREVINLLDREGEYQELEYISSHMIKIPLSFEKPTNIDVPIALTEEWPALVKRNNDYDLVIQYIELGEKLGFLSCNAEFVHEYGRHIKRKNKNVLPLGYSNGMIGYVPTKRQLEEGGYEAEESLFYFGYPGKLSLSTQYEIQQQIEILIGGSSNE